MDTKTPRKYSKGELRIMRLMIIALLAIGGYNSLMGFLTLDKWPKQHSEIESVVDSKNNGKTPGKSGKKYSGNIPLMYFVGGVAFLALGIAGAYGITKVINNGGKDMEFDPVDKNCV